MSSQHGAEAIQSEELFRSLMEQSPLAIELLSPDGQIWQVNAAWHRLWDVNQLEMAELLSAYNMLSDTQINELGLSTLVRRAFDGESVVLPPVQYDGNLAAEETGVRIRGLRAPWIQCHLYPIKDMKGNVTCVVNTYMDITELKLAEQDAREQRDALARVGRATMMGQLTGSISHELNQPLTGILSNAQAAEMMLARGQLTSDELAAVLAEIASDAMRAGELIRGLLDLYREQKGDFQPVDINAVVDDTMRLLRSEFVIQGVRISTDCTPSRPSVDGIWVQIQQVLVNLIMNGMDAMKATAARDRQIRVTTAYDEREVRVWVEDSGHGIDETMIERIFEPLATWKPNGTGIGLAVSDAIIKAHSGFMWAENRREGGARVGFTLPAQTEHQPA